MIDADRISPSVERAVRVNNPNKIAQMGQDIQRGDRLLRSWLEERSGKVLLFHGDEIYATIAGEHLSDLGEIHGQLQEAWKDGITIGVGLSLNEASKALEAGKKRGGSRIVFYAPEIERMVDDEESASDSHDAKNPSPDPDELKEISKSEQLAKANTPSADMGIHAIKHRSLQMDRGAPSPNEPSPIGPPQASASGETPLTPSTTNMAGGLPEGGVPGPSVVEQQFHSAAAGTEAEAARAEAQANAAQPNDPTIDKVKQTIAKILQKVKQQAPVLEQLKDQAPDAYQAVVASIQAMLMMAKALMPQSGEQPQPKQEEQQEVAKKEALLIMEDLIKSQRDIRAVRSIVLNDQATPEQLAHAEKIMKEHFSELPKEVLNEYIENPNANKEFLLDLAMDPDKTDRYRANDIFNKVKVKPEVLWAKAKAMPQWTKGQIREAETYGRQTPKDRMYAVANKIANGNAPLTPELQNELFDYKSGGRRPFASGILTRHDVPRELVERASRLPTYNDELAGHHYLPVEKHNKLLKAAAGIVNADMKKRAKGDVNRSWEQENKVQNAKERLKMLLGSHQTPMAEAEALSAKYFPNEPVIRDVDKHHILKGSSELSVKPGLNRIRQIRDTIEGRGGEMTPADLGKPIAQALGNVGRLPNGNFSSKKIQEHIDTLPGLKFYATEHAWPGGQKHSQEPSKVLRVSMPTEVTEKLRAIGVKPSHGHTPSHPGEPHSGLGWIRWTGDHKGVHIDEIQHDYDLPKQKLIEQMLGHPINRILTDAFHEWVRTGGGKKLVPQGATPTPAPNASPTFPKVGTPVHIWTPESKAPISGLNEDEPLPAHFHSTYRQNPEKMGFQPGKYGELPTQVSKPYKDKPTYKDVFRKSVADIRQGALRKAYSMADTLQPKSTGIDNQVKVQSHDFPSNDTTKSDKIEQDFNRAPESGSRLSKIRKSVLAKKATGDAVTGKPDGMVVEAGDRSMSKGAMPMPEASNKRIPTPSGAQVARTRGDATPQAHKYRHIEPGEAAHVSMDGRPAGKIAIRQAQSGQALPNEQVSEGQTGLLHPTSALDPKDGRGKQGNQQG